MLNCFCGIVDQQKVLSLIFSRDQFQKSSPSRISDTPRAGFEPTQNLSSGFVEKSSTWSLTQQTHTENKCTQLLTNIAHEKFPKRVSSATFYSLTASYNFMQKELMSQFFEEKQMARQTEMEIRWKSYQDCLLRFFCFSAFYDKCTNKQTD